MNAYYVYNGPDDATLFAKILGTEVFYSIPPKDPSKYLGILTSGQYGEHKEFTVSELPETLQNQHDFKSTIKDCSKIIGVNIPIKK